MDRSITISAVDTELILAVKCSDVNKVTELLSAGYSANICEPDFSEDSLLHLSRSADVVRTLLARGADVNLCNNQGETPLLTAIRSDCEDRFEIINELLNHNVSVNHTSDNGDTALNLALKKKYFSSRLVIELFKHGADINNGSLPLECALSNADLCDLLIKYSLLYAADGNYQEKIDLSDYEFYRNIIAAKECVNDCIRELDRMKRWVFHSSMCLYELVTTKDEHITLALYPDNEICNTAKYYRMYNEVVAEKILVCLERGELLTTLRETEVYTKCLSNEGILERKSLNCYAITSVGRYLTNDDISNLIAAFWVDETSIYMSGSSCPVAE